MTYKCPACGNPLHHESLWLPIMERFDCFMWCSIGRCTSQAANDGATGSTLAEAYQKLCEAVENEDTNEKTDT